MNQIQELIETARKEPAAMAIILWRKVLEMDVANPEAIYSLSECLASLGRNSDAVLYLNQLREVSETLAKKLEQRFLLGSYAMCDIAERLVDEGKLEEAKRTYEQAQILFAQNVDCRVGQGRIAMLEENIEEAIRYFHSALAIEKENEFALLGVGDALLESNPDQAIEYYSIAIAISPNEPYAFYQRASAYEKIGQSAKANEDWAQVTRLESIN
ncbi:tetratricopeptide repeat protein [Pirellulaceae bacterium SH467]